MKNWLKMKRISRENFGGRESSFIKLCHVTFC